MARGYFRRWSQLKIKMENGGRRWRIMKDESSRYCSPEHGTNVQGLVFEIELMNPW